MFTGNRCHAGFANIILIELMWMCSRYMQSSVTRIFGLSLEIVV